jgi:hypothetical protein
MIKPTKVGEWIFIDSYKDIPEGKWLVMEEKKKSTVLEEERDPEMHIAKVTNNSVCIIGGHFGFDRGRIYAYTLTPKGVEVPCPTIRIDQ